MNLYEQLAENFFRWAERGRGHAVYPAAVELEPAFLAFPGHRLKVESAHRDTGTKPTLLSRLADKMFRALQPPKTEALAVPQPDETAEPFPDWFGEKEPVVEFQIQLAGDASVSAEAMSHFLTTLSLVSGLMGLEIVATAETIIVQVACQEEDADIVMEQLEAQFPDSEITWSRDCLLSAWEDDPAENERLVLDFGLFREFMRPLATTQRTDPFVSLIGGMTNLSPGEAAVYQVLFTPLRAPWKENALAAVTKSDGKPFFEDGADLVKDARAKTSRPLYGVVLRLAAKSPSLRRTWDIVRGMAPALRLYSQANGQSFMPLPNTDYDEEAHRDDLLKRRSRRSGMILNLDELVALAHLPSPAVKCAKLARIVEDTTRAAPTSEPGEQSLILGINDHAGEEAEVLLSPAQRLQHMHVIGGSGTGKSTLLLSLILQDLEAGRGFCLIDPHGDLIDRVLASVPDWRMDEVVLIDPSDEQHITPFNVLSAHSDHEKNLLASDLVSLFRRQSTSWGDRMGIIFQNLVLAFLEHSEGGTLADMRRFLVDDKWRASFLAGVDDPDVSFYWTQTFPKLDGPKSIGPILTRLETLLTPKVIRYMVSQRENRIDFSEIMDEGRILLVRLPQGQIGKENAFMLGSLVMVKIQQMAMGRARLPASRRTPFFCYVDECQHFVTPSMAEILSGARKYGLGLVLAHQDLHQLSQSPDVAAAVMTNAATRIVFRVSESDGRALKGDFAHYEATDFATLPTGHALCRIGRADQDFNLRVIQPEDLDEEEAEERRLAAIEESRTRYTIPRGEVEAEIRRQMEEQAAAVQSAKTGKAAKPDARTQSPTPEATKPAEEKVRSTVLLPAASPEEKETAPPPSAQVTAESNQAPAGEVEAQPARPPRTSGEGVGGASHRLLVQELAQDAQALGFWADKEFILPEKGRVDLALGNSLRRIAIEVAMTNNPAHELDNLAKCLAGNFSTVFSVSPNPPTIAAIAAAATAARDDGRFTPEQFGRLQFLSPSQFLAWLRTTAEADAHSAASADKSPQTKLIGGRKVSIRRAERTPEQRRIEEEGFRAIAEILSKSDRESA